MRIARTLGALLLLALLLFGVPLALSALGGPGYLLTVDWRHALVSAGNSRLILALLSLVGWLAWLLVALTIGVELVAVLSRQRITVRLPGTGWLRPLIGGLVMTAIALPTLAQADAAAPPVVVAPLTPQAQGESPEHPPPASTPAAAPSTRPYTVQVGDELWTVAEQQLGSGERWREIAALTPGLGDSLRLTPGEVLFLPVDPTAQNEPAQNEPAAPTPSVVVVVQRDDSLWRIAERTLGNGERWGEIFDLNRDQIADPDEIDVGWVLRLPDAPRAAEPAAPSAEPVASDPQPVQPVGSTAAPVALTPGGEATATQLLAEDPAPLPTATPLEGSSATAPAATATATATSDPADRQPPAGAPAADQAEAGPDLAALLGPIGALLAAGLVVGVATRRRTQLLARALGRRIIPAPAQVTRFWAALASHSESAAAAPATSATAVVLGWDADGEAAVADVERERSLIFDGGEATAAVSSVITTLSSAPWAESVELVLVGNADWARALDDPRITSLETAAEGLTELARRCSQRRIAMRSATLPQLREQPDLAASWVPIVYVFETPLSATQLDAIADALALGEVGVSVVGPAPTPSHIAGAAVHVEADEASWGALRFTPQLVTEPARRVLVDLFGSASTTETEPAPWWCDPEASVSGSALSPLPSNVLPLPRHEAHPEERLMPEPPDAIHPTLLLLGEVDLQGTAGEPPQRALAQCMEYCAWLLSNPGATPTVMVQDLLVAETTRRSNMSRLRTWLGSDEEGAQYLPDAYSGRISLDERVSSDWERFEALLAGGVNGASSAALRQALRLVRGVPLGSLGFQWHWAQTLRTDMVSMIVDAACVLADRAIDHEDVDTALWAVGRGRLAAPESDLLSTREIHALAVAHRQPQLDRAILTLNRSVRADGRDLDPELARRVQLAIHLSSRAAQAGES